MNLVVFCLVCMVIVNLSSYDAFLFCSAIAARLPGMPGARDKLVATISSAAVIGAARTCNFALRRLQLASLAHAPLSFVNSFHSSLCAFDTGPLRPCNSIPGARSASSLPHAARNPQLLFSHLSEIFNGGTSVASEPLTAVNGLGASRPLPSAVENCGA